jgi:tetratricopeptide (TPR) repeat protein
MKKYIVIPATLFAMLLFAAPVWAQIDGTFRGVAKEGDGKPIVGATVVAYNPENGRKYSAKTNAKGEYIIGTVYTGTYKLTLLVNGNPVDEHNNVPVAGNQEQIVNFEPAKDAGGISPEQAAKVAEAQKQNEKVKGLNASLQQAKELEGAGNFDQAITVLQQATQVDPNQDLVWAYLGDAQRGAASKATDAQARTKYYQDAVESYQKALALKPTSGVYMGGLAQAYSKTNQTDKAVEQYNAAAAADPSNAAAYYFNEGAALTNAGKLDEANAAFDKALQLDPNRAEAYYWKGVNGIGKATVGKDGKMSAPAGTAEDFNKYLELAPTGRYANEAKQMLASIGASVETTYGKSKSSSSSSGGKKK